MSKNKSFFSVALLAVLIASFQIKSGPSADTGFTNPLDKFRSTPQQIAGAVALTLATTERFGVLNNKAVKSLTDRIDQYVLSDFDTDTATLANNLKWFSGALAVSASPYDAVTHKRKSTGSKASKDSHEGTHERYKEEVNPMEHLTKWFGLAYAARFITDSRNKTAPGKAAFGLSVIEHLMQRAYNYNAKG